MLLLARGLANRLAIRLAIRPFQWVRRLAFGARSISMVPALIEFFRSPPGGAPPPDTPTGRLSNVPQLLPNRKRTQASPRLRPFHPLPSRCKSPFRDLIFLKR